VNVIARLFWIESLLISNHTPREKLIGSPIDGREKLIGYPEWVMSPTLECYTHAIRQKKSRVSALAAAQRGRSSSISFNARP
jgi:hypothetical protein